MKRIERENVKKKKKNKISKLVYSKIGLCFSCIFQSCQTTRQRQKVALKLTLEREF